MATNIRRIGNDTEVDSMLNELLTTVVWDGYVEVGEERYVLTRYYEDFAEDITNFQVRDEDIFIGCHPKTGSTWMHEMVWMIVNDLDYEGAKQPIALRTFYLETSAMCNTKKITADTNVEINALAVLENAKNPRCIKTHLPWSLLPEQIKNGTKKPKIITTLRNPHDVAVSYYHHSKLMYGFRGNFEDFCKMFLAGRWWHGPFWKTVLSYWNERHRSNILFVKYSEMLKDLPSVIKRVATFLGKSLTDEEVDKLAEHLSFENMKNNPAVNKEDTLEKFYKFYNLNLSEGRFMRCGKEKGYKEEMSPELVEKFDSWTKENMEGTGLTF